MSLKPNQFVAPSGDKCEYVLHDGNVLISNPVKKIDSKVTFEEAEQAAKDYPTPNGWPLVLRSIRQKQAREVT